MNLTPNFTLVEFTRSGSGEAAGIDNTPPEEIIERLRTLATSLEHVRRFAGGASISIKSGYRNTALNALVGGSDTSAHKLGWAADIKVSGYTPRQVAELIAASPLKFDQLILEDVTTRTPDGVWVHISIDPKNRREVKTMIPKNGKKQYLKGLV